MRSALFYDVTDDWGQIFKDKAVQEDFCSETSVNNYQSTLLNFPEERRYRLLCC